MAKRDRTQRSKVTVVDNRRRWWIAGGIGAATTVIALVLLVVIVRGSSGASGSPSSAHVGSELHSLVVNPANPAIVSVGGHTSSAVSSDGGRTFRVISGLDNADTMAWSVSSDGQHQVVSGHGRLRTSDDSGSSWVDETAQLPGTDVHAVGLDPAVPSHIWAYVVGRGVSVSMDGGRSWSQVGGANLSLMGPILVRNSGASLLAADMMQGLVDSADGGKTWQAVGSQIPPGWLASDPNNPQHILDAGGGVFTSNDGGTTWQAVTAAPSGATAVAVTKESRPGWLVGVLNGDSAIVYRSDDAGITWHQVTT